MSTDYPPLFAFSFAFTLTACDNKLPAYAEKPPAIEPVVETPQALKLNVNDSVLKKLPSATDEQLPLSESLILEIKPVEDQQRLSVNGKLLLRQVWQANYLDNIDGGKLELQLRFDD